MLDPNPLAHRYYLATVEAAARGPGAPRPRRSDTAAAPSRVVAAARRLLLSFRSREVRRA